MPNEFQRLFDRDISSGRISTELVQEAYQVSGLVPKTMCYFDEDFSCGCALGAIFVCAVPRSPLWERKGEARRWADMRWPRHYVGGFVAGFDGDPETFGEAEDWDRTRTAEWKQGHADGKAAAELIFAEAVQ